VNDAYATYLAMNKPNQLTKQQVEEIKKANDGSPVAKEEIQIDAEGKFSKALDLRENDVYFVNMIKR
jgi:xylan 1,4-beta-xylosidase